MNLCKPPLHEARKWGFKIASRTVMLVGLAIISTALAYAQSPPDNDDFANATLMSPLSFSDAIDTTEATTADDDPDYMCGSYDTGSESVWYQIVAEADGLLAANTFGSSYDTMLALWTGSRGALSSVACNDDSQGLQSQIQANIDSGVTYYLEVADYHVTTGEEGDPSGDSPPSGKEPPSEITGGSLVLEVEFAEFTPSLNDDIDNATEIDSFPFAQLTDTSAATTADDDPSFPCGSYDTGSESVWYQFTPEFDGLLEADTFGSNYDTMIALWTGSRGALENIACNDQYSGNQSKITAQVEAGVLYYLEVTDYIALLSQGSENQDGGRDQESSINGGQLSLSVNLTEVVPVDNDDFDNAVEITSVPFTDSANTTLATTASDDPIFACGSYDTGSESVWYTFTPNASSTLQANTFDSDYDTMLALWTGSRGALESVTCNDQAGGNQSQINTVVDADVTYYLEVAGYIASYPNGGNLNLLVEMEEILYPDIEISTDAIEATLPEESILPTSIVISNTGEGVLDYTIGLVESAGFAEGLGLTQSADEAAQAGSGATAVNNWQPITFPEEKIEPALQQRLMQRSHEDVSFLVYLSDQADLSAAAGQQTHDAKGQYVYEALFDTAQNSQADLLRYLKDAQDSGAVSEFQPFYIVNAIAVTGTADVVTALEGRAEIAYLELQKSYTMPEPILSQDPAEAVPASVEWGIATIGAEAIWNDFEQRGQGIVVANIDTGVLGSHPALVNQYRGTLTGSHDYNWFDPSGTYPTEPGDNNGHGTHTMGTMVGDDGDGNQIGVAPDATWIAAKGCAEYYCTEQDLLASAEWVLAPYPIGGTPADGDPTKRPHVVNNSWGGPGGDFWYQAAVNSWRAANIFPAFAAGNSGPGSGTLGSPGDYAESFASGATDSSDQIAYFSSRGPSASTTEMKPDISAPGVDIRSALNDGTYGTYSGTSMASPHVAGCAALLYASVPGIIVEEVETLLTAQAVDLGELGADFTYGHGRMDCYAAIAQAGPGIPWLEVEPRVGTIAPGENQTINVLFNSEDVEAGEYSAELRINSNDPDGSPQIVSADLTVTGVAEFPNIDVSPSSFEWTTSEGENLNDVLTICNQGTAELEFALQAEAPWLSMTPVDGIVAVDECQDVNVAADVTTLAPGDFENLILIDHNDPNAESVMIPTLLHLLATHEPPVVTIAQNIPATPASTVDVPIEFYSNDADIIATTFSVDFDDTCLVLDPENDGLDDDVLFNLPEQYDSDVTFDATDTEGELDLAIFSFDGAVAVLPDGVIATIKLDVRDVAACQPALGEIIAVPVLFSGDPVPTFGNASGVDIPGLGNDGSVAIQPATAPRGDCNDDGTRSAGDVQSLIREIFDGDGSFWEDVAEGSFIGSPTGCDANGDEQITAADLTCSILIIFNGEGACGQADGLNADVINADGLSRSLNSNAALLSVGDSVPVNADGRTAVPVGLDSRGNAVSAAVFTIDHSSANASEASLYIDQADSNGDGIPDAIDLNVPQDFATTIMVNESDSTIDILIADMEPPFATLDDDTLLTITFAVESPVVESPAVESSTTESVGLNRRAYGESFSIGIGSDTAPSLGSNVGTAIPVVTQEGSVLLVPLPIDHESQNSLYLPLIQ